MDSMWCGECDYLYSPKPFCSWWLCASSKALALILNFSGTSLFDLDFGFWNQMVEGCCRVVQPFWLTCSLLTCRFSKAPSSLDDPLSWMKKWWDWIIVTRWHFKNCITMCMSGLLLLSWGRLSPISLLSCCFSSRPFQVMLS